MTGSPAARLAEALRAAMKAQTLNGAELAKEVERLTGACPSPVWVSRRVGGSVSQAKPLLTVDDDLFVIAEVLGIDQSQLARIVLEAIFGYGAAEVTERGALVVQPRQEPGSTDPYDSNKGGVSDADEFAVPRRPTEAELDPSALREAVGARSDSPGRENP